MSAAGHSAETRERIGRGQRRAVERKRQAARLGPRDLVHWRRHGVVAPALRPLVDEAGIECHELLAALGDPSPMRRQIIEDVCRLGVALRALLAVFVKSETPDREIAATLGSLASARTRALAACGLDVKRREVDLATYLAAREAELAAADGPTDDNRSSEPPKGSHPQGSTRGCNPAEVVIDPRFDVPPEEPEPSSEPWL